MWSRTKFLAAALVIALGCGLAAAADFESQEQLRVSLQERFVLLPLSDGLLLQPLDAGEGPRAIEISGSGIALDGQAVGNDELRLRLGVEAAQLVLAVAELDDDALEALTAVEPGRAQEAEPGRAQEAEPERVLEVEASAAEAAAEVEASSEDDAAIAQEEEMATADARAERAQRKAERAERAAERARRDKHKYRRTGDTEFAVGGSVIVDADEVTEDVLVMGGFLKVEGRVEGNATVMAGSATIEGEVTGNVTAIGGPVRLEDGSFVHGDVTSVGGRVFRDDGARVGGDIEQRPMSANFDPGRWGDWRRWDSSYDFHVSPWHWWSGIGWSLACLLFLAGLAWLALLLAPGPIDRMERRIEAEPWKTGLVGLLTQVLFFPVLVMLTIFLAISIIGIPLLLILPFALLALVIVAGLGFVAVAGRVGSWAEDRFGWQLGSPYWVVLLGLGLIAGLSFVGDLLDFGVAPMRFIAGMFMFFGAIVSWAACTIGFGAAVLTRFGTAESWNRAEDLTAPLPAVPRYAEEAFDSEGDGTGVEDDSTAESALEEDLSGEEPEAPREDSREDPREDDE